MRSRKKLPGRRQKRPRRAQFPLRAADEGHRASKLTFSSTDRKRETTMSHIKHSRDDNVIADQKMIDGIQKNRSSLPTSFVIRSRTMALDDIITMFQGR